MDNTELSPVLIEDFNLDHFTEGMSDAQKKSYYQGFSRCFKLCLSATTRQQGVYRFPTEGLDFFAQVNRRMIDRVAELNGKEVSIEV